MDGFEVCQVVVGHVDTDAEVETSVAPVNDLKVPELWEQNKTKNALNNSASHFIISTVSSALKFHCFHIKKWHTLTKPKCGGKKRDWKIGFLFEFF